ncbi:hypothetical protein F4810DRAFT_709050 [Camillea tinctor]|nr:hypothetical protein F4810DRAFT_709050 [Camillea tinctor]
MAAQWNQWVRSNMDHARNGQNGGLESGQKVDFALADRIWGEAMGRSPSPKENGQAILTGRNTTDRPPQPQICQEDTGNRHDEEGWCTKLHRGHEPERTKASEYHPTQINRFPKTPDRQIDENAVGRTLIPITSTSPRVKPASIDRLSQFDSAGTNYSHNQPENEKPARHFRHPDRDKIWMNQDWNETRRPKEKKSKVTTTSKHGDKEDTADISYLQEYIDNWLVDAHHIMTDFLYSDIKDSEDCDVDTFTGKLLPPVEYPVTKSDHDEASKITSEMRHRLFCQRSSIMKKEKRAMKKAKQEAWEAAGANAPKVESPYPQLPDPDEVQVPSHLRPAEKFDIEGVTEVYNKEVRDGYKVMDANPVTVDVFRQLFLACQDYKMPFVVAVQGWHQPNTKPNMNPNPRIIGFALVDVVSRGIGGSHFTRSRHGGKITVLVDPEFRRKRIGSALLDAIMSSCSQRHNPYYGYQFVNPQQDLRFMRPFFNVRKWHYLEMEVIIRSGENEAETRKGDEFQWVWNYLEQKYLFVLKRYEEKVLRGTKEDPKQCLDKLTFHYLCRDLTDD